MVLGATRRSRGDLAVSVTGVAGPGGGSAQKPVGLVWMGLSGPGDLTSAVELRWDPVEPGYDPRRHRPRGTRSPAWPRRLLGVLRTLPTSP
jgi:nicotinamide mononucleotide (NMN) deamidase PncC